MAKGDKDFSDPDMWDCGPGDPHRNRENRKETFMDDDSDYTDDDDDDGDYD